MHICVFQPSWLELHPTVPVNREEPGVRSRLITGDFLKIRTLGRKLLDEFLLWQIMLCLDGGSDQSTVVERDSTVIEVTVIEQSGGVIKVIAVSLTVN